MLKNESPERKTKFLRGFRYLYQTQVKDLAPAWETRARGSIILLIKMYILFLCAADLFYLLHKFEPYP